MDLSVVELCVEEHGVEELGEPCMWRNSVNPACGGTLHVEELYVF